MSPNDEGGPLGPPFSFPTIQGWEVAEDLVWINGEWSTRWTIYILMPSGHVASVTVYDRYPPN